jgi:hypothetical protein
MSGGFGKKLFPVVAAIILFNVPHRSWAQYRHIEKSNYGAKPKPYMVYGIKIGPSFNQFTQPGSFIGLNAGFFGKHQINESFNITVEALYSLQGGGRQAYTKVYNKADQSQFVVNTITNINPFVVFHNLEIPLLVEFGFPELRKSSIQPRFSFGGSYSMVIRAYETKIQRYNYSDGSAVDLGYIREDVADRYKKNQYSAIAAIGLDFKTARRTFFIEVRYRQGLTQLNKYTYVSPGTGDPVYSSSLLFNGGITF